MPDYVCVYMIERKENVTLLTDCDYADAAPSPSEWMQRVGRNGTYQIMVCIECHGHGGGVGQVKVPQGELGTCWGNVTGTSTGSKQCVLCSNA